MRPMLQRRRGTFGSAIVLAGLAAALLIVVGIPSSAARAADDSDEPTASKTQYAPQAEDQDRPRDKSLLDKTPADGAVAAQAQADQGPPFYQRWQFWAITGAVVVGAVAAVWGGATLYHSIHGGDVRPCMSTLIGCYGQGEPQ
jgi:hypothetical protein